MATTLCPPSIVQLVELLDAVASDDTNRAAILSTPTVEFVSTHRGISALLDDGTETHLDAAASLDLIAQLCNDVVSVEEISVDQLVVMHSRIGIAGSSADSEPSATDEPALVVTITPLESDVRTHLSVGVTDCYIVVEGHESRIMCRVDPSDAVHMLVAASGCEGQDDASSQPAVDVHWGAKGENAVRWTRTTDESAIEWLIRILCDLPTEANASGQDSVDPADEAHR